MNEGFYVLLGTVVGGLISLAGQYLIQRAAAKQALVECFLKEGLENWKEVSKKADHLKMPRHDYGPTSRDAYLLRSIFLIKTVSRKKIDIASINKALDELALVGHALHDRVDLPKPADAVPNQKERL